MRRTANRRALKRSQVNTFKFKSTKNSKKINCIKSFGLFEAMSAIEMMDPKMDAGLASKKKQAKVASIADALEVKYNFNL